MMLQSNHTANSTSLHKVLSVDIEDPLLSNAAFITTEMGNIPKVRVSD